MSLNLVTLPQAQTILSSRVQALADMLKQGMSELWACPPLALIDMTPTNKAANIASFWYGHCVRHFAADPGVSLKDSQGQRYLDIDGQVWVRIKLINRFHLSTNAPTRHSRLWNTQLPLEDPSLPHVERLELGYIPDPFWTRIDRAYILLRVDKRVVWLWQIWGARDDVFLYSRVAGGVDMLGALRFVHDDYSS